MFRPLLVAIFRWFVIVASVSYHGHLTRVGGFHITPHPAEMVCSGVEACGNAGVEAGACNSGNWREQRFSEEAHGVNCTNELTKDNKMQFTLNLTFINFDLSIQ
jgi:hypothetical protein